MKRRYLGNDTDRDRIKALLKSELTGWQAQRLLALRLGFDPRNSDDAISEAVGKSKATIYRWFATYREGGLEAVLNRGYEGTESVNYNEDVQAFIKQGLAASRWNTAVQAQQQLERHFGRRFSYKTVWRWLKKVAGVLRVPRPVHQKRNPAKAEQFKRTFYGQLKALPLRKSLPVKVWFAHESRYGLLPNLRRLWTFKGHRPHKLWQSKYTWSYCYGALDIVDGQAVFIQTPTVNLDWTQAFLNQIKAEFPEHQHVVVWDGAGFHPRDNSHPSIPDGVHTIRLPPYSPELNPIEKLWDLIQDHTANKLWPNIERLDQGVAAHLQDWWLDQRRVIRLVGNGWARASANDS